MSLWHPSKSIVTPRYDREATSMHLAQHLERHVEFFLLRDLLRLLKSSTKCTNLTDSSGSPINPRCHNMLLSRFSKQIRALIVDPRGVVNNVYIVPYAHLDAVPGSGVSTKSCFLPVRLVHARC